MTRLGNNLSFKQKESIFLLQIGTFLEYFDLMIYIHMAVLLNELFFPPTDPKTSAILSAFAFCSTYVLRPFGALIFGYIGDNWGRKPTVIITTTAMAVSCLLMANLPTYAQIGINAAIMVSLLRIVQGMTSMGEIMGAIIYATEITKPPIQYPVVCSIPLASAIGSMAALGIATISTNLGFNWRIAFWIGTCIALVGGIARTRLRETPEFIDAKRKMEKAILKSKESGLEKPAMLLKSTNEAVLRERIGLKNFFYFLIVHSSWPLCFYLSYMYLPSILKNSCSYSAEEIILQNFYVSITQVLVLSISAFLSYKIYPLFISKFTILIFLSSVIITPFVIGTEPNPHSIFLLQILFVFGLRCAPSDSIVVQYFPVFKRFTAVLFGYAFSRAVMYIVISFGLVYLTDSFGYYGVWIIAFPLAFLFFKAIEHYESLEKASGNYPPDGKWQV